MTANGMGKETDSVTVYINGSALPIVKNITKGSWNNDNSYIVREFYVSGQYEPVQVEIHMFPTTITDPTTYRAYRRLRVGETRLVPSESELNYR